MNFIDIIFFVYIFIGLYMLILFLTIYVHAHDRLFKYPKSKAVPISIVVPCYNEEKTIAGTLDSLLNMDYPKGKIEIIIVDDRSKDNTAKIAAQYSRKHANIRLIINKRNSGAAAEPTNIGVKAAKYDLIAVTDADSYPEKDALKKMLGFIQEDEKVGAVTCSVLAKKPRKFIQKLQEIEYITIAFGRKLLDEIDSVYVTPGPFALYRKEALLKAGLFDTKNLTQDIEIIWNLLSHGYKAKMCLATRVYSETPDNLKAWWKQRIRWNIGGTQTLLKYRKYIFGEGMLGFFIIPFFMFSLFLGLFGLALLVYLALRKVLFSILVTKYSVAAGTAILNLQGLTFNPSILNFFGIALFLIGMGFTLFGLGTMNKGKEANQNFFNTLFYLIVYLTIQPINLIEAMFRFAKGNYSW